MFSRCYTCDTDRLAESHLTPKIFGSKHEAGGVADFLLVLFWCTQAAPKRGREDEPEERLCRHQKAKRNSKLRKSWVKL